MLKKQVETMSPVPFDTLAYAKKLESRGIENSQAEAHAEALAQVLEVSFSSKQDSINIINHFTFEIDKLTKHFTFEIDKLRQEFAEFRQEMKAESANIRAELIKWMFGISFAQAALIISFLKFFH